MRRAGDPKVVQFTSRYFKGENAHVRFYSMYVNFFICFILLFFFFIETRLESLAHFTMV